MRALLQAIRFLTIIPVPGEQTSPASFSRMAVWFPWIGGLLGVILLGFHYGIRLLLPQTAAGALTLAAWVVLTGGLHLDGLGDCCDAFFASVPLERRLEILKDVHKGSFGVAGIAIALIVKYAGIASLTVQKISFPGWSGLDFHWGLLVAPLLARWMVLLVAIQPRAHRDGLGVAFARDISLQDILLAAVLPVIVIIFTGQRGIIAALVALVALFSIITWARSKIGGVSGDVLGMTIEICETVVLFVFCV